MHAGCEDSIGCPLPAGQPLPVVHRRPGLPRRVCRQTATPAAMAAPFLFTPVESGLGGLTLGLLSYAKFSITGRCGSGGALGKGMSRVPAVLKGGWCAVCRVPARSSACPGVGCA